MHGYKWPIILPPTRRVGTSDTVATMARAHGVGAHSSRSWAELLRSATIEYEAEVKSAPWRRSDGGGNEAAGGAARGTMGAFFKAVTSARCVVCNKPCSNAASSANGKEGGGGVCSEASSGCQAKAASVRCELDALSAEAVASQRACASQCRCAYGLFPSI